MKYTIFNLNDYLGVWLELPPNLTAAQCSALLTELTSLAYNRELLLAYSDTTLYVGYVTLQTHNNALRGLAFAYSQI